MPGAQSENLSIMNDTAENPPRHPSATTATEIEGKPLGRSTSSSSIRGDPASSLSRSGTLMKRSSIRKRVSLSRRGSMKSLRSMTGHGDRDEDGFNSIFNTPIPTHGTPTDILASRFQAWRKLLKDLITYFREIQSSYENRSKSLLKISNVLNNTQTPPLFLVQGGLDEALTTLRGFHKVSMTEASKARDIEDDVITQLNGLRGDLSQKIKEIKSLAGDFKNSVEKEKDATRKAVEQLRDALEMSQTDPSAASGKGDPFIVRLNVERQVEKQIEEENYLHRAYLNLEGSGRELESIVVGEIQKAYNAYVGILRRESDHAYEAIDDLRAGPIAMPKDQEWSHFVEHSDQFVNPKIPLRQLQDIYYPGKFDPGATEIRGGMLERKSKYLKSYTPGWYVLSPTHLHEFKSADHIHAQQPVMSLYLLDQKLGSHSQAGASSHKFSLKGRQTGAMHRGHSWVFRAESFDTMLAWYEDIRILTEKTGAERTAFVRQHARSVSGGSQAPPSVSSDGLEEDEADAEPYAAKTVKSEGLDLPKRPSPGGRFPSDINVNRERLQSTLSPSSGSSQSREYRIDSDTSGPSHGAELSSSNDASKALEHVPRRSAETTQLISSSSSINLRTRSLMEHTSPLAIWSNDGTALDHIAPGAQPMSYRAEDMMNNHSQGRVSNLAEVNAPLLHNHHDIGAQQEPMLPISKGTTTNVKVAAKTVTRTASDNASALSNDISSLGTIPTSETGAQAINTNDSRQRNADAPQVLRQNTQTSVSQLHVPGEYPPTPAELV